MLYFGFMCVYFLILNYILGIGKMSVINEVSKLCLEHYLSNNRDREVIPIDKPHLSLSRPFVLRFHQIQMFIDRLEKLISHIFR